MNDQTLPILEAMSKAFNRSYFADAPENQNTDFQTGYERGLLGELSEDIQGITTEWERRGKPATVDRSFSNWKCGYWAGRFTRASGD